MLLRTAKTSLFLLVFSLCYIQPFVSVFNFDIPPTEFIFLFTMTVWLAALITGKTKFHFHKFYLLLFFYFTAMLVSAIFSDDQQVSFIKLSGEIYLLSLPVLIFNLVRTDAELKRMITFWLVGTAFALIYGIIILLLFYLERDHWLINYTVASFGAVPVGNYPRLRLGFLSPSLLCNYLSVSFSLLLIAERKDWIGRRSFLIFAALTLLIAAFTISSGLGGFALIVGLWIFLIYRNQHKRFAILGLSGGLLTASMFWVMNFIALQPHSTAPYTFNVFGFEFYPSPRLMIWEASWKTFRENFIFGRGVGRDSCEVLFENTNGSFAALTDAHNVFLSVASQEGIFGLAAITAIIIFLLRTSLKINSPEDKISVVKTGLWIAFFSAFVYQGLVGSFEDSRHLWVLIGMMLCVGDSAHCSE